MQKFFPWRVFRRFFLLQLAVLTVFLSIFVYLIFHFLKNYLRGIEGVNISDIANLLQALFTFGFFVCALITLWIGQKTFRPLGRLNRTLRMGEQRYDEQIDDLVEEEPEEWAEVSMAVSQMTRSLRKQNERAQTRRNEVETLMSEISDAIVAVDREGHPLLFNRQFVKLFTEGKLEDRRVRLGEIIRTPEILNTFQGSLQSGQPERVEATTYVKNSNLARHFSLSVAPLRARGHVYGVVGIFHDVTDMKRAEQARIDFVGNVSHEIRSPLTSIKGYTDTLREDIKSGQSEQMGKHLDIISSNVDRMVNLVNDLLDLSSLESGVELNMSTIDPRMLTENILYQLESLRTQKKHEIKVDYQADKLFGDERRIEQVLTNLVHNAIKYIPSNGRIDISWKQEPNGGVTLRVRDNGPGIAAEHLPRLFERFYRVDKARSREMGGTGLGLSIVKHIMRRHNGNLEVQSELGRGTEFICHFPGNKHE